MNLSLTLDLPQIKLLRKASRSVDGLLSDMLEVQNTYFEGLTTVTNLCNHLQSTHGNDWEVQVVTSDEVVYVSTREFDGEEYILTVHFSRNFSVQLHMDTVKMDEAFKDVR